MRFKIKDDATTQTVASPLGVSMTETADSALLIDVLGSQAIISMSEFGPVPEHTGAISLSPQYFQQQCSILQLILEYFVPVDTT